jgi:preprotein translocase subunit SecD
MYRTVTLTLLVVLILFCSVLQAQAQFTIRAASDQAVPGWDQMEYQNHSVWVSPTISLTSADILRAEPIRGSDGRTAVGVTLTDAGAQKMRDLSSAQMNSLVAIVLDGNVIFAPKVRGQMDKEALITGNTPSGLPADVAQRIVDSVNRK